MATWVVFQNKGREITTDEANSDNQRTCDFCGTCLGSQYDEFSDLQEEEYRYFYITDDADNTSATICLECVENFSMFEKPYYQEPVIAWRGQFGNEPPKRIEDLDRKQLVQMIRKIYRE